MYAEEVRPSEDELEKMKSKLYIELEKLTLIKSKVRD